MTKPIILTSLLIVICFAIGIRKNAPPEPPPEAPVWLHAYVDYHLKARSDISITGTEVLDWLKNAPSPKCSELDNHYSVIEEGRDRVNGVECLAVRFKPDLKLRPWIQLWIDPVSKKILSAREWSAENRAKPVGISLESDQSPRTFKTNQRSGANLPEGFRLVDERQIQQSIQQQVYSDGLQVVSVFKTEHGKLLGTANKTIYQHGVQRIAGRQLGVCDLIVIADLPADVLSSWANIIYTAATESSGFKSP